MSCEGEARRPCLLESRDPVPTYSYAADGEPALSCACLPSAAAPRPRPLRCGLIFQRARRVKAAQEVGLKSGGALALALTVVLHLGSRTEAASSKESQKA